MSLKQAISKRSPQIFLAAGITGFVAAIATAAFKSDRVKPIIKKAKEDYKSVVKSGSSNEIREKSFIVSKAAIDISKEMAIPIGLGMISTGCLLKSYKIMNNRQLALVGTIDILDTGLKTYKHAVEKEVGEETVNKIEEKLSLKEIKNQLVKAKKPDGTVCTDVESFSRYFSKETSNKFPEGGADTVLPFLKAQETYFNQLLHNREKFGRPGVIRFNEVLDALGFPKIPEGETAGWISRGGKGFVDFGISGAYYADYDSVLDVYNCIKNPEKIPHSNSGYMLCFNVDPYIVK